MAMIDRRFSLYKALIYLVMLIFTVLAVYPILWLIVQSFKTTQEYLSSSKLALPKLWFTGNYPYAWRMEKDDDRVRVQVTLKDRRIIEIPVYHKNFQETLPGLPAEIHRLEEEETWA